MVLSVVLPDDLPELGSNLVAALAGLDVDYFSHVGVVSVDCERTGT